MIKPINARRLINSGWTIQNRRILQKTIGQEECRNLISAFNRVEEHGNAIPSFIGNVEKIIIRPETSKLMNIGGSLRLAIDAFIDGFKTPFKTPKILEDKEISVNNISNVLENYEKEVDADYPNNIIKQSAVSKTINLLYTDKYKPTRRFNEDGYPVTTVIDKKTMEPVEAFFVNTNISYNEESWFLYIKTENGNEQLGYRSFKTNIPFVIFPGYMESSQNDKFIGIGTRLHQLTVERAIQLNKEKIIIDSFLEAFIFHYKSGFRMPNADIRMSEKALNTYINDVSKTTGITPNELKKYTIFEQWRDRIFLSNKTEEFFKILSLSKNNINHNYFEKNNEMILEKANLEAWKKLAESQPILL